MAWTYDETDLSESTASGRLNAVRLLVGDTDTLDQQLLNEEVDFSLVQAGDNVYVAASWCARVVASKYARRVNTEVSGALKADYSDLYDHYTALSDNLETQGRKFSSTLGFSVGGIDKTVMELARNTPNRLKPSFTRDRFRVTPNEDLNPFNYE
jgi:hypothetical protein